MPKSTSKNREPSVQEMERRKQQAQQSQEQTVSLSGLAKTFEDERNEARGQATFWRSRANDLEAENSLLKQELERRISESGEEDSADEGEDGKSDQAGRRSKDRKAGGSGASSKRRAATGKRN